jgi:hypothetical protein
MSLGSILWSLVAATLVHLLVYAAFRPYTDSLPHRIGLAIASFGTLFAIMTPILRGQGPGLIPLYFAGVAVSITVFMTIFHLIDRRGAVRGT